MDWLFFALLAPLLWAASNFVDKWLLEKYIRDAVAYQMLLFLLDIIALPFFLVFVPISTNLEMVGLTIGVTMVLSLGFILYNKAIMCEEASRVATLIYIGPVFVLPLAAVFLGETLNVAKYVGVLLLVASAILATYRKVSGKKILSPALFLMLAFSLIWAVYEVASKYILTSMDFWSFTFWHGLAGVLMGCVLIVIPSLRKRFTTSVKRLDTKAWTARIMFTGIWYVSLLAMFFAISLGPVSLVAAVPSVQPLFALFFALMLTRFAPRVLKEKFDKSTTLFKVAAVLLVIVGTWLITT